MITNNTIYEGKPFLTLERYPEYIGQTKLNKVHLDLGFIKLVSRVSTKRYDEAKVKQIASIPGITIKAVKYAANMQEELYELEHPVMESTSGIMNWCLNKKGEYIGDLEQGWWMLKKGIEPDEELPNIGFIPSQQKWAGWTHRGYMTFGIGDILFDENWKPRFPLDYYQYFQDRFHRLTEQEQVDLLNDKDKLTQFAVEHIPYRYRGQIEITDLSQARQAALNASKHLS